MGCDKQPVGLDRIELAGEEMIPDFREIIGDELVLGAKLRDYSVEVFEVPLIGERPSLGQRGVYLRERRDVEKHGVGDPRIWGAIAARVAPLLFEVGRMRPPW